MFGLFGKKPGSNSLLADGSFAFFGCLALLFVLMAAPLLALVIVSREGLAALASNVAAAFGGDRLWILATIAVIGMVVRYAIAGPLVDWLKAREAAKQKQVHYPPTPTIELYRGFSPAEMRQYIELNKSAPGQTVQTGPTPPTFGNVPFNVGGRSLPRPGENQAPGSDSGGGPIVRWRR